MTRETSDNTATSRDTVPTNTGLSGHQETLDILSGKSEPGSVSVAQKTTLKGAEIESAEPTKVSSSNDDDGSIWPGKFKVDIFDPLVVVIGKDSDRLLIELAPDKHTTIRFDADRDTVKVEPGPFNNSLKSFKQEDNSHGLFEAVATGPKRQKNQDIAEVVFKFGEKGNDGKVSFEKAKEVKVDFWTRSSW